MKKLHILIPSLVATTSMPLVSLVGCGKDPVLPEDGCFTVTALKESSFLIQSQGSYPETPWFKPNIDYSFDNGKSWTTYDYSKTEPIIIGKNAKVMFKGNNPNGFHPVDNIANPNFAFTGLVELSGNIMSLLDNGACKLKTIPCDNCFSGLFRTWTGYEVNQAIKSVEHLSLPATKLTSYCYSNMFDYQGNLITPMAILPSMALENNCYTFMFSSCRKLTTTPYLPATTLTTDCYRQMFEDDGSLKIKQKPLSSSEQKGLIFKYEQRFNLSEVSNMFGGISPLSEYKESTPEPGYSYYWYID